MTRFRPGPQLDERVATRWAVPEARRLADSLAERVRANAPDAAVWITAGDERVRKTHEKADGQTIPNNLRWILDHPSSVDTDTGNGGDGFEAGLQELARFPRDPDLSIGNRINCRCVNVDLPGLIAEHVAASDVMLRAAAAVVTVSVSFSRIVESEHPNMGDAGGGWLTRAVEETALSQARPR